MFGMLDYRAYRLRLLLFFIPQTLLVFIAIIGLPLANYSIGLAFADTRFFQILVSLISLFILETLWLLLIFVLIERLYKAVFWFFIDVIPADGRTTEEAQAVAWSGEKAIRLIEIGNNPQTWSDQLIRDLPKNDWAQNVFYGDKVRHRLSLVRSEAIQRDLSDSDWQSIGGSLTETLNKENGLERDWLEKLITEPQFRSSAASYVIFGLLLLLHPFG